MISVDATAANFRSGFFLASREPIGELNLDREFCHDGFHNRETSGAEDLEVLRGPTTKRTMPRWEAPPRIGIVRRCVERVGREGTGGSRAAYG